MNATARTHREMAPGRWTVFATVAGELEPEPIGWVMDDRDSRPEHNPHPFCVAAVEQGRPFHAIPRGFAIVAERIHFETVEEAAASLPELEPDDRARAPLAD